MSALPEMTVGLSFGAARMEDLTKVMSLVDAECRRAGVPEEAAFAVRLAVEEAFTNIVLHGYGERPGPIRFELGAGGDRVAVTLVDEAPLFEPSQAPPPDLESEWAERRAGGLGWHLVRELMDEVHHRPGPGRGNVLTLIKRLPGSASR